MIKSNELRRGNLVLFDENIDTVLQIGDNMCYGARHSHWYYNRIHGIPLTPHILEKAGFIYSDGDCINDKLIYNIEKRAMHYRIWYNYISPIDGSFKKDYGTNLLRYLDYVHELQNLYFALTGEELQINLTSRQ